jgi:putative endonuclease
MTSKSNINDKIGRLGEELVSQWLEERDWRVLYRRWLCRWGEIDLIARAKQSPTIAFVEIKTRSLGNWDLEGILAINARKQAKICRTATLFLSKHPHLAELNFRFDVALVSCRKNPSFQTSNLNLQAIDKINSREYSLSLHDYLENAFFCS